MDTAELLSLKNMKFQLFCIFALFILNITIHSLVENSHVEVPDFRYSKTMCTPGYNYWSNEVNDVHYIDVTVSPYMDSKICWVFRDNIHFRQPYLPYEFMVFLDIFVFMVGLFFF